MEIDLDDLARQVRYDLDIFVPHRDQAAIGEPLPEEWFTEQLACMRTCLISPRWIEMRDQDPGSGDLVILKVALVAADPEGSLVAFDPRQGDFVLAIRDADPDPSRGVDAVACGVRGDAVDCFLSR